ncbi:MAG: CfrBI family restriction endonuclease [Clostridiales bacterium]|nr:CfrBI family restriction endonuclease [Clostridiales bacterium]
MADIIVSLQEHIGQLLDRVQHDEYIDKTWLLMMAGSATLYLRGSDKSKIGKTLEGVLIRSMLTILGLHENENFWMNIDRDAEVDRETDCEIRTIRGRIRVEVGLIASGNQEVVEDKIGRVGTNGVVLFDKVGGNTRIYETADRHRVKLIQIRNNQPLVEMYRHLSGLVNIDLREPPELEQDIIDAVNHLPAEIFQVEG